MFRCTMLLICIVPFVAIGCSGATNTTETIKTTRVVQATTQQIQQTKQEVLNPSDNSKPISPDKPKDRPKDKPVDPNKDKPAMPEPMYKGKKMSYWLERLQDSDYDTASNAGIALVNIGEPAFDHVYQTLSTTKSDVTRQHCINVLARDDGKGIPWLQKAFAEKNADVAFWGAFGLIAQHFKYNTLPATGPVRKQAIAIIKASESTKDPHRQNAVRTANKMIAELK